MEILSIPMLLRSEYFSENQSSLAWLLGVSRNTLRKYLNDVDNLYHVVIKRGDKYTFMCVTKGAKSHQYGNG